MEENIASVRVNHPLFGEIDSITTDDGKVWYRGRNVASALGYKDTSRALSKLNGVLNVMTDFRMPNGVVFKRPVSYIGKEAITILILRRTTSDINKCWQECIRKIELI